jgi:hypothetical protein
MNTLNSKEGNLEPRNDPLFKECLVKAEGNRMRALAIYKHLKSNNVREKQEDLDQREKWPMLAPLLIIYTLGTIGVLGLVFGILGSKLNWW